MTLATLLTAEAAEFLRWLGTSRFAGEVDRSKTTYLRDLKEAGLVDISKDLTVAPSPKALAMLDGSIDQTPPIPLTSPDGKIYAYACPRCHRIPLLDAWRQKRTGPEKENIDWSRERADDCCRCRYCHRTLADDEGTTECASCEVRNKPGRETRLAQLEAESVDHGADERARLERNRATCESVGGCFLAAERLRYEMSEISEAQIDAEWIQGLEFNLWAILQGGGCRAFGRDDTEVGDDEIASLRALSEHACGWWSDAGTVFVPIAEWVAIVTERGEA